MSKKSLSAIQGMYETYKKKLGHVYTPEEFGEALGGAQYPKPFVGFNRWATPDTITHFVDGTGDLNPLYRDEGYARKSQVRMLHCAALLPL